MMVEMLRRERSTRLSEIECDLLAMGGFMGAPSDRVLDFIENLKKELKPYYTHEAFSSRRLISKLRAKLFEVRKNQKIIEKVEKLTAPGR